MTAPHMELRRAPQEMPTRAGFYYAYLTAAPEEYARPCCVHVCTSKLGELTGDLRSVRVPLEKFTWFGPVPVCVESGK